MHFIVDPDYIDFICVNGKGMCVSHFVYLRELSVKLNISFRYFKPPAKW